MLGVREAEAAAAGTVTAYLPSVERGPQLVLRAAPERIVIMLTAEPAELAVPLVVAEAEAEPAELRALTEAAGLCLEVVVAGLEAVPAEAEPAGGITLPMDLTEAPASMD